jgi:hypothetical protein
VITETTEKESKTDETIVDIAHERFQLAVTAEHENRALAVEDFEFRIGDQWPDDIKRSRDSDGRPCLTINKLSQFIRQITNDQRQNRPSVKVNPVDDVADPETAKVLQGLIRHIEYNSNADVAYDRAFDAAATAGFGYFRVTTDYCDPTSFDQDILIKSILNPMNVYLDPSAQEPDGSDANWGFIFEDLTPEDYKQIYPNSEAASMEDWRSIGDNAPDWATEKTRRVAEYFYKVYEQATIYLLSDGQSVQAKSEEELLSKLPPEISIVNKRETTLEKIKWAKINGVEVLEESEWAGRWIPIIPVYGEEVNIDGKKYLQGIVRQAKDSQRMYNYWVSTETEAITLAPKSPWIVAEGQLEGYEHVWAEANRKNFSYLTYKPTNLNGQPVAPPQRSSFEPAVMAITNARMQSGEDMKSTIGMYDAALGNRSNESSGVAIQRRNQQAQTANFHFVDNLSRAQRHCGRILVDLIPKIYDTPRAARIIGEDGEQELVKINELFEHKGKQVTYDLSKGKYDVTVATGPSYQTKRQEAVATMLDLTKSYPNLFPIIGDLMLKNMDVPGADEMAKRLKKTAPPGVIEQEGQPEIPPEMQNQMQQQQQMVDQLTQALNEAQAQIDQKSQETELKLYEIQSKEKIEYAKIESQMRIELLKQGATDTRLAYQAEIDQLDQTQNQIEAEIDREHAIAVSQAKQQQMPPQEQMQNPMQEQIPTGGAAPGQPFMEQ